MSRPVVVVGASGWIGRSVMARMPEAVAVSAREVLAEGAGATIGRTTPGRHLDGLTIVNVAGAKSASLEELELVNTSLVTELIAVAGEHHGHLVQLGSAAEYGLDPSAEWVDEDTKCQPSSDYGKTKYAGTVAALDSGLAMVLRPFNIAANPPQAGSPLEDMVARTTAGISRNGPVELLSPDTRRDYVTLDFVVDCIEWAVAHERTGIYNLATGIPIRIGDFAEELVALLGASSPIVDLGTFPPTTISADPAPWRDLTGLASSLDARGLARLLAF